MRCGAVIPAAGSATRLDHRDKTLLDLDGRPVLEWVLRAMVDSGAIAEIVIAASERNAEPLERLLADLDLPLPCAIVPGGATRRLSVLAGVQAIADRCDLILIHDAARPFVGPDLIVSTTSVAQQYGAAIAAIPVTDTIKRVHQQEVVATLERTSLVAVQTPQVFRTDWLLEAYQAFNSEVEPTDESSLVEAAGHEVRIVPGDPSNIKITNSFDLEIAECLLARQGGGQ